MRKKFIDVRGSDNNKGIVILSLLKIMLISLFIISFSIALPLIWRGFYYWHIEFLKLDSITPWSYTQIKEAFDDVMNFCIFGSDFGTGVLKYSAAGKAHFEDCRRLFRLDFILFFLSIAGGIFLTVKVPNQVYFWGHGVKFWGGILPVILFVVSSASVFLIGFDNAFVIFHKIFFPGKTNWIFYPWEDEIIQILPERFFADCALLIFVSVVLLGCVFVLVDYMEGSRSGRL